MKECDVVGLELPGYGRGWLDGETESRVTRHLEGCPSCARELVEIRRLDGLLAEALSPVGPSAGFASRFANRLAAEVEAEEAKGARGLFDWVLRPWMAPVAASALALAVFLSVTADRPDPTAERLASSSQDAAPVSIPIAPETGRSEAAAAAEDLAPRAVAREETEVELFVDYAIIEDLELVEYLDRAQAG